MYTYVELSQGVRIEVTPQYLDEYSEPSRYHYVYGYHVSISNLRKEAIQLLRRHWVIVDSSQDNEEVVGEGVVGQQPWIDPGENFRYTSFCPLSTARGSMRGRYVFQNDSGQTFESKIPLFFLRPDEPKAAAASIL